MDKDIKNCSKNFDNNIIYDIMAISYFKKTMINAK